MKKLSVIVALLMCLFAAWAPAAFAHAGPVFAAQAAAEPNDEWHRPKGRDDSGYRPDIDDYKGILVLGAGIIFAAFLYMIPDHPPSHDEASS